MIFIFFGILLCGWLVSNSLGVYAKEELVINNTNIIEILAGNLDNISIDAKDLSNLLSGSTDIINYIKNPSKEKIGFGKCDT